MITLSRSILEDAARCKRKFLYKHILEIPVTGSGQSASEGTIIHAGLAAAFNCVKQYNDIILVEGLTPDWNAQLKSVALTAMADLIAKGTYDYRGQEQQLAPGTKEEECVMRLGDVVQYYIDNQMQKDLQRAQVIAVEENFLMPIPLAPGSDEADFALEGQLDLVLLRTLEDGKKVLEVFDHKTVDVDVKKNLDYLDLDVQFLVYEWIVNEMLTMSGYLEEPPNSVEMVYNLIRRDRPPGYGTRELKYNLNGSVSKQNASQDPADYLRQERRAHTLDELAYVESELFHLALNVMSLRNMAAMDDQSMYTRTVIKTGGEACTNCAFFVKCKAELIGHGQPNWLAKV